MTSAPFCGVNEVCIDQMCQCATGYVENSAGQCIPDPVVGNCTFPPLPACFWLNAERSYTGVSAWKWSHSGIPIADEYISDGGMANDYDKCLVLRVEPDGSMLPFQVVNCSDTKCYPACMTCGCDVPITGCVDKSGRIHKEGLIDRRDCSSDYCKAGQIVTVKSCPPLFESVKHDDKLYCYFLPYSKASFWKAREMCPRGSHLAHWHHDYEDKSLDHDCVWVSHMDNNVNSTICQLGYCIAIKNGYPVCLPCDEKCNYACEACDCDKIIPSQDYPGCTYKGSFYSPGSVVEIYPNVCMKVICNEHSQLEKVYVEDCCTFDGQMVGPGLVTSISTPPVCMDVYCRKGEIVKVDKKCDCYYEGEYYDHDHVFMENTTPPGPCYQMICDNGDIVNKTIECTRDCEYEGKMYPDGTMILSKLIPPKPCYEKWCRGGDVVSVPKDCQGCIWNGKVYGEGQHITIDNTWPLPCFRRTCKNGIVITVKIKCQGCWYKNKAWKHMQIMDWIRKGGKCIRRKCVNYNKKVDKPLKLQCCNKKKQPICYK